MSAHDSRFRRGFSRDDAGLPQEVGEDFVPRRQKLVAGFAVLTLLWSTWAQTAATAFTVLVATGLAALTLAWLFLPTGAYDSARSAKRNFFRLMKFPLFWIGIALWIYICIQGCVPGVSVEWLEKSWRIHRIAGTPEWLPTGVDAGFGFDPKMGMNAWRQLCIFGAPWMILCALWCGLRSRRAWKFLLWTVLLNAVLLACFGLYRSCFGIHSYLGETKYYFFSVFSYKNHAGEFFVLAMAICAGLGLRSWRASSLAGKHGGAYLILLIFGLLFLGATFATKSVGAVFLGVLWLPLIVILICASGLMTRSSWLAAGVFLAMLLCVAGTWWATAKTDVFFSRVDKKVADGELPDIERVIHPEDKTEERSELAETFSLDKGPRADLRKLSAKMFHYNTHTELFGWGAGSYRWIAPAFQLSMPEFTKINKRTGKKYLPTRTSYAHCDPWHFLVEWGAVGAGIFAAGVLWFWGFALRNFRRWRASSVAFLAGIAIFSLHACVEFVSFNPALMLCVALLAAAFKADLSREKLLAKKQTRTL